MIWMYFLYFNFLYYIQSIISKIVSILDNYFIFTRILFTHTFSYSLVNKYIYSFNILDDIHNNLNSCYLNRNKLTVIKKRRINNIFLINKNIFLKVRKTLSYSNKKLDFVMILRIISIMYLIMFEIFDPIFK